MRVYVMMLGTHVLSRNSDAVTVCVKHFTRETIQSDNKGGSSSTFEPVLGLNSFINDVYGFYVELPLVKYIQILYVQLIMRQELSILPTDKTQITC